MSFNKGMVRVGAGLPGLLKDGYQHLSGIDEAVAKNIEATKQLSAITRTSLGPNGMNKLVINHLQKLFVTSDAATICQELEVIHPAANLVVMAAKMQESECGDATNFIVTFVGELLTQAEVRIQDLARFFSRIELNLFLDTSRMSAPLYGCKLIQQNAVRHMLFLRSHDYQVISK